MKHHLPAEITRAFPCDGGTPGVHNIHPPRLQLPEGRTGVPLIVRITSGEDTTREQAFFAARGFAMLCWDTDQPALERDPEGCSLCLAQLQAHLDALLQAHPVIDPERIYLDGWLTAYIVFRTRRFRAAVQRPALIDPASAYGNCAAGWVPPDGTPLLDTLLALAEQSVLAEIDRCGTPCLALYRMGWPRYSREQTEIFYSAMKDRNPGIPCRLAVFPQAAPEERVFQEILHWWERFAPEVCHG